MEGAGRAGKITNALSCGLYSIINVKGRKETGRERGLRGICLIVSRPARCNSLPPTPMLCAMGAILI